MKLHAFACISIFLLSLGASPVLLQKSPKKKPLNGLTKLPPCCEEVRDLKVQIANLSSLLEELTKKQESDWVNVVMQVMKLEGSYKQMETRVMDAEGKYSEMNNQIGIMQLQAAAQTQTQTTAGKRDGASMAMQVVYSQPPSCVHRCQFDRTPAYMYIASL